MNCFVASAFGHKDIDAIYDGAIRPVLKELKIHPSRVDRVEHNDDIDDRIFRLIDQSQLCIADLTFARPSVYYEAGYAFGSGKPVIYIARSDHFRERENDEAGNLRVHFDLQMKNIIPWTGPNETFKKRLRSRLRHVLSPLRRSQQWERAKSDERNRFAALSQNEKLASLLSKSRTLLHSHGFRERPRSATGPLRNYPYYARMCQTEKNTYVQVHIIALPGISKTSLEGISWLWYSPMLSKELNRIVQELRSYCVIVSLRPSRQASLTSLLPNWKPLANGIFTKEISRMRNDLMHTGTIMFITGIRAESEFLDGFSPMINIIRINTVPATSPLR